MMCGLCDLHDNRIRLNEVSGMDAALIDPVSRRPCELDVLDFKAQVSVVAEVIVRSSPDFDPTNLKQNNP